jgi:uncharacterized membrane protein
MTTRDAQHPGDDMAGEVEFEAGAVLDAEVRAVAAERLTFFSDAVIAIALTLLALDLPVPRGDTDGALLRSAFDHREEYLAFGISFAVIAAQWSAHHRVFRYVTTLGGRLTGLSLLWLFLQVVTPFATRVITGGGAFEARFDFYAAVECAAFALFLLMLREIRTKHLYREGTPADRFSYTRTGVLLAGFLLSIPVSFLTHWAYVCWALPPMVSDFWHRARAVRRPPSPSSRRRPPVPGR